MSYVLPIRQNPELFRAQLNQFLADIDERLGLVVEATVTANTTFVVPAGWVIRDIFMAETASHAVTGGVKIGTTSGATDVVTAQAVGSGALVHVSDATLLKRLFSLAVDQTLYVQAVTSWNSASVKLRAFLSKAF